MTDDVGEVLVQRSTAGDVQNLDAAADREQRQVGLGRRRDEGELEGVACRIRLTGARVGQLAVVVGRNIRPAREHDPVDRDDELLGARTLHGEDEHGCARPLDRRKVLAREDRGAPGRVAPGDLLFGGGDANDGPCVHRVVLCGVRSSSPGHRVSVGVACPKRDAPMTLRRGAGRNGRAPSGVGDPPARAGPGGVRIDGAAARHDRRRSEEWRRRWRARSTGRTSPRSRTTRRR